MNTRHLMLYAAALTMSQLLSSCANEPLPVTQEEKYTHAFIANFGMIAPDQDWNTAQSTTVTLDLGPAAARSVKMYAKVGDSYFITADLANVSGTLKVPVEVPDGSEDIMVMVDGRRYNTVPGGTVDIVRSRGLSDNLTGGTASSGIFSVRFVETGNYTLYNAQQIAPIVLEKGKKWNDYYTLNTAAGTSHWRYNTLGIGGLMPEIQDAKDQNHLEGNQLNHDLYHDVDINKDFYVEAGEDGYITIQPVYWQTSGSHILGIYPVDNNFNPISKTTGEPIALPDIKTVLGDQYSGGTQMYTDNLTWEFMKTHTFGEVKAEMNSGNVYSLLRKISDALKVVQEDMVMIPFYADKGSEDIWMGTAASPSSVPERLSRDEDPMPAALNAEGASWTAIGTNSPTFTTDQLQNPTLARSKTFQLTVYKNDEIYYDKYCMYIDYKTNVDRYFFSQTLLNYYMGYGNPCPDAASPTFAASYKHPMSERTYFSFEDWSQSSSDMDINDLIFLLNNVKTVGGTSTIDYSTTPDIPVNWIWAVEDLGSTDDFDFNDVVVKINSVTTNYIEGGNGQAVVPDKQPTGTKFYKKVTFTAMAAGGTMETYIKWIPSTSKTYYLRPGTFIDPPLVGGTTIDGVTPALTAELAARAADGELHRWFGDYHHTTMINTDNFNREAGASCVIYTSEDFTVDGFGSAEVKAGDVSAGIVGLAIEIANPPSGYVSDNMTIDGDYVVARPGEGAAPQMFIIHEGSTKWCWPRERKSITSAYGTAGYSFKEWVGDKSIKWFEHPTGNVVTRIDD